jgi:hypothetical protein
MEFASRELPMRAKRKRTASEFANAIGEADLPPVVVPMSELGLTLQALAS